MTLSLFPSRVSSRHDDLVEDLVDDSSLVQDLVDDLVENLVDDLVLVPPTGGRQSAPIRDTFCFVRRSTYRMFCNHPVGTCTN